MPNLAPPPLQTPLIQSPTDGLITKAWGAYFRSIADRAQTTAASVFAQTFAALTDAQPLTTLVPIAAGRYRVSYELRVTTPAGVSSSVQAVVTTVEGGVTCTQNGPALTANATNQPLSGAAIVNCDPSTPLQASTVYSANPANGMAYSITWLVEFLG